MTDGIQSRRIVGARIEAMTILGGDYGLADGEYRATGTVDGDSIATHIEMTKVGGSGEIGDPQPLGHLPIGWQPRVEGNMGWLNSDIRIATGPLAGDVSHFRDFSIEFGGGARFWLSQAFSIAPTVMGIYGRTTNSYTAVSALGLANLASATQAGLVNWEVQTWTLRPAVNLQYLLTLKRTIITLSSDATFFHTESFKSSNARLFVAGDSGSLANKIDVDIPLGIQIEGHELRTGGYLSRTELYGGLENGIQVDHLNEIHARVVLDFLSQLWKAQWIGIGGSYLWGPGIEGWTVGADVNFRF